MKVLKKQIPILLLLLSLSFVCTTCEREEKYDDVSYYDTVGIGYVFIYDYRDSTWYPAHGAEITIATGLKGSGSGIFTPPPRETFTTDATGKYQVRFIKRTHLSDASRYYFEMSCFSCIGPLKDKLTNVYSYSPGLETLDLSVYTVRNAKNTIIIDTIKVYIFKHGW